MASDKILIEVEAKIKTAIDGLKKVQKEEKRTEKTSESLGSRIKSNWLGIGAAVAGAAVTIKKAFEFTKAFADFDQSSKAMSKQFGVDADKVIKKLKQVSAGTISNKDLVLAANKAMALNVTKDVGQMSQLLEFARIRARSMGLDTTQAFEDIVTGIGRASPLILDNLGIITKGWNEEAKSAGVAYDAQFILNKVLAQSEEASKQAGGGALTMAERFNKAAATAENLKVRIGQSLAPTINKIFDIFEKAIEKFNEMPKSMQDIGIAIGILVPIVGGLLLALGPVTAAIGALGLAVLYLSSSSDLASKPIEELMETITEADRVTKIWKKNIKDARLELAKETKTDIIKTSKTMEEMNKRLKNRVALQGVIEDGEKALLKVAKIRKPIDEEIKRRNDVLAEQEKRLAALRLANTNKTTASSKTELDAYKKLIQGKIALTTMWVNFAKDGINAIADLQQVKADNEVMRLEKELEKRIETIEANDELSVFANELQAQRDAEEFEAKFGFTQAYFDALSEEQKKRVIEGQNAENSLTLANHAATQESIENEKAKTKAQEDAENKITATKSDAFEKQKKSDILSTLANGIVASIKVLAQLGLPAGPPAAAVMLGLAGASAGAIGAKANPYATGGFAGLHGRELIQVGERGAETVLPADLTALLVDAAANANAGGGDSTTHNNTTNNFEVVANDSIELVNELKRQYGMEVFG